MKKFEEVQMNEKNEKWEKAIHRQEKLYNPVFGAKTMRTQFDRD